MNESPNPATDPCDLQQAQRFLESDHYQLDEPGLIEHLDRCQACREYLDEHAAEPEIWRKIETLLKPSEYDQPGTAEFAAATAEHLEQRPVAVSDVLELLTPSEEPHHLGRLGIYEVTGVIGVGGMGVVLKAVDPPLDRVVAVKVMAPHFASNDRARKRFSREAKAAAAVIHPNVIPIHHVSNNEKLPYLVMAYHRGGSLQKRLDHCGPLPTEEVLRIGEQIAAGLAAAHERGIVHRDIKPENILLEDGVERVTITDFGLARAIDDNSVTQMGTIAGTPMYMSPEQARGEPLDQRSDLFSLGSVLYALCAGQPPYVADSSFGVMRRIIDEDPVPLRQLAADVPDWLEQIVNRLMAKEKADRFESAQQVHRILKECLGHFQSTDRDAEQRHQALAQIAGAIALEQSGHAAETCGKSTTTFGSRQPAVNEPAPVSLDSSPGGGSATPPAKLAKLAAPKRFVPWIAAAICLGILGLAGFFMIPWQQEDAKTAYKELREIFKAGQADAQTANLVDTLLTAESGSGYLSMLDQEFEQFGYVEGDLPLGIDAIAGVVSGENQSEKSHQRLSFLTSKNGFTGRPNAGSPADIHVRSIQFLTDAERGRTVRLVYHADDPRRDPNHQPTIFDLDPEVAYYVDVHLADLLSNRVDWQAVWREGYPVSPSDLPNHDQQRIRGPWKPAQDASVAEDTDVDIEFFVSNFKIVGKEAGADIDIRGKYTLDPSTTPKSIDLDGDGMSLKGIYELDGDALKILLARPGSDRPTSFEGDRLGAEGKYWVLKRVVEKHSEPSGSDVFSKICDKYSMPTALHELICKAASVPTDQLDAVLAAPTRNPNPEQIDGYPLSWLVFRLSPNQARANIKVLDDFRFLGEPIELDALVKAMSPSKSQGFYSVIQPSYIKTVGAKVEGDRLVGECQFQCDAYSGTIDYAARIDDQFNLEIVEFTLPNYGIKIVKGDGKRWERVDLNVESEREIDQLAKSNELKIKALLRFLQIYKLSYGEYPSTEQGLEALINPGPNGQRPLIANTRKGFSPLEDAWGQPFNYRHSGDSNDTPEIWSDGPPK